ncbi:hypothetical protein NEDG_00304 [Nematocida displodere]|uniref:Transmembrane protein n=1 Tax=Nematocida displodere TaxID=1805483 RepID=A0A177ELH5_9MICR|nr:hypothetical protein NEDG_00304 [Nematocida displodere]
MEEAPFEASSVGRGAEWSGLFSLGVSLAFLYHCSFFGSAGAIDASQWVLTCGIGGLTIVSTANGIASGVSNSLFFFFCAYFFCLLGALVVLLNFLTLCFTLTDNIAVSGTSFIVCSCFMVLFYTATKESVCGGVLSTVAATAFFFVIELFIIALVVVVLLEPALVVAIALGVSGMVRGAFSGLRGLFAVLS